MDKSLQCYLREYNPGTITAFKFLKAKCSFINELDPRDGILINTPTLHDFIDTIEYEVIISSDYSIDGHGFMNSEPEFNIEFFINHTSGYYHYLR